MSRGRVGLGLFVLVVVGIVFVSLQFEGSPDPFDLDSSDESGYLALRLVVEQSGVTVDRIDAVDVSADQVGTHPLVYVPVASGATPLQVEQWRAYVEAGGTLVLGTPVDGVGQPPFDGSGLADEIDDPNAMFGGFTYLDGSVGECDIDALADAEQMYVPSTAVDFDAEFVSSCFGDGDRALIVTESVGAGEVVNIASPDLFSNVIMGAPTSVEPDPTPPLDNGFVAVQLFAPSESSDVLSVVTTGVRRVGLNGSRQWTEFVGAAKWAALFQLAIAFVWYAWFRARRMGRVVTEPLPVTVEGSEYVGAVGNLLRRQGNAPKAAATIRQRSIRRFERDVGLPPGSSPESLVGAVARRTGRQPDEIAHVLVVGPIADDAALSALALQLEQLHQETQRV